jgi:hypothetical protein
MATTFFIYKVFSEKYKGKNAIGPFLLPFLQKRLNQLNSWARLLIAVSVDTHIAHIHMAIRPYFGHMAIFVFGHMASNVANLGVY